MEHLKIFINLTRLNKPIGFMLLFWPCSWGLALAYSLEENLNIFLYYILCRTLIYWKNKQKAS